MSNTEKPGTRIKAVPTAGSLSDARTVREIGLGNFVAEAVKTESKDFEAIRCRIEHENVIRLLHAAIGMETEAGEFIDALKKHIFYGKPLDLVNLQEELGDQLWYIAIACDVLGVTMEAMQMKVISKLRQRYPEKFSSEHAINRDLDAERKVLENNSAAFVCAKCSRAFLTDVGLSRHLLIEHMIESNG